jgi:hypothetical protein
LIFISKNEYVLPTGPYDYVDPISFNRGPVRDEAENDRILGELGLPPLPKRAKRRKKKNFDSEDDDDNEDDDDDAVASNHKRHNKKRSSTDQKSATRKSKSEKKSRKDYDGI